MSAPPRERRAHPNRVFLGAVAALLAVSALAAAAPAARGAELGLALVTQATYTIAPAEGRVHVALNAVATALTPDTATEQTVFTGLTLVVPPGAVDATAVTVAGSPLPVAVAEASDELTAIDITFDREVRYTERYRFTVTFDLADPGGQANRDVRIGTSLVAFPVWAFGSPDTAGSGVEVHVPTGYAPAVEIGELVASEDGAATVLRSGAIDDPLSWFAYVTAEAPGAFVATELAFRVGADDAELIVRAWEDDAGWGERTASWMRAGVPALSELIGLPWPIRTDLEVEEAATSRLGGYAGAYDDLQERIHIRYDADAFVALHEAAHAWFNRRLIEDRWIGEAFASLYAEEAGRAAGLEAEPYRLDAELEPGRIALNAWGAIGAEDDRTEDFAYAATYEVARLIADRATVEGLQPVWRALDAHRSAYQPIGGDAAPEGSGAVTQEGWQRLLDFVEEATGDRFDDLWRTWVVTDAEAALLDERADARLQYAATITLADGWELPRLVRHVMAAWDFDDARAALADVDGVLRLRARLDRSAASLALEPPGRLRSLFEAGPSLAAAEAEAIAELATLDAIERVTAQLSAPPSALAWIGLAGSDPAAALGTARAAFEDGDSAAADAAAARAAELRIDAPALGRDRVTLAGAGLLGLDGLLLVAVGALRQRGRAARPTSVASNATLAP